MRVQVGYMKMWVEEALWDEAKNGLRNAQGERIEREKRGI